MSSSRSLQLHVMEGDEVNATPLPPQPPSYLRLQFTRFLATLVVAISKIFPAGFLWEGFALAAVAAGEHVRRDGTVGTYLLTGLGDSLGVLTGHLLWRLPVTFIFHDKFQPRAEVQTALFLASASFLSGSSWQLVVNLTTTLGFYGVAVITGTVCACMFFIGLRAGRAVYGRWLGWEHLLGVGWGLDAQLAASIGGASFLFVATDTGVSSNPLINVFGVEEHASAFLGMFQAGASTFCGFLAVQAVQNLVLFRHGRSWLDAPAEGEEASRAALRQHRDALLTGSRSRSTVEGISAYDF